MPSIINNRTQTMSLELKKSLKQAESIDIITAYFYFSGFNEIADELKTKKIRILVGKVIDHKAVTSMNIDLKKEHDVDLDDYEIQRLAKKSNTEQKELYIKGFIELFNNSALSLEFDTENDQKALKIFLDKIQDGSLEIKLAAQRNHGKAFIITNKSNVSLINQKGVVITGSSNFTYSGLKGQIELNEKFESNEKYDEYMQEFERYWNDSKTVDINTKDGNNEFLKEIKQKLWLFVKPSPYNIFIRILHELYSTSETNDCITPADISKGRFLNFKYQLDAIKMGIECLETNNGVIIADVVGLGKSIVAAAIAHHLDISKTVIIAPPHLIEQWNDYQQDFGLRGVKVESAGKIDDIHKHFSQDPNPILYIIDEAHRFRNEFTDSYQYLHQLTRSNPQNKVILLTATPYNNRPKELYSLIKLFQTPNRSTISTVDHLGYRFTQLILEYKKIEKVAKKEQTAEIRNELDNLSFNIRTLIAPIVIRRSRIDLQEIEEYKNDLELQKITFPVVVGPELVEYDLGQLRLLYISTLEKLSIEFACARYKPATYLIDHSSFMKEYGELFETTDLALTQINLAQLIKRILVMRFESSKKAFQVSLEYIINSYQTIIKYWDFKDGYVPIWKRGYLEDPDEIEIEETLQEIHKIDKEDIDIDKIRKRAIPLPKSLFKGDYIIDVNKDLELLLEIQKEWFSEKELGFDPKLNRLKIELDRLLKENKNRKIIIFSVFSTTTEYLFENLKDNYKIFLYTGTSVKSDRNIVRENFDASFQDNFQKNDFDILIATDTLSEGINLHRAGVVINYDIPYNPTRVVQRIGRINRIDKKMYEKIFIYNFFPTDIGEEITSIKGISTLKMLLINNIIGSDTKTLTPDETLQSYFKKQFEEADKDSSEKSWDNEYLNIYNQIKHNKTLLEEIKKIPARTRIVRKNQKQNIAISFAKRGNSSLFALAKQTESTAELRPAHEVLPMFRANFEEEAFEMDNDLEQKFTILRDEITKPTPKQKIDSQKARAIEKLEKLLILHPAEKNYLNDLLDIIKEYDDLCDGELKIIRALSLENKKAIEELKSAIPIHYIRQIKEKAESVETQSEIILFTEDLRK